MTAAGDGGERIACPRCRNPVIRTPSGTLLDPEPDPLAIRTTDGGQLHWRAVRDILTGRRPPAGHHRHAPGKYGCNPPPEDPQPTLF